MIWERGSLGHQYNIGTDASKTNLTLFMDVAEAMGKRLDQYEFVKDRPGHDRRYSINSSKLRDQLGWVPEISFQDGIKETIDWYTKKKVDIYE